jgi:two-component system, sensor histidine kinase and response regulator
MNPHTILVADDQPDNLKTIVEYLKDSGAQHEILIAPNGKIACEIADEKLPDLIITDWEMPEMNGIETIHYLKKGDKTRDIPIIIATGVMTSAENFRTALEAGAVDFIRKPIDKTELIARVKSMLDLSDSFKKIKSLNATKDKFYSIITFDLKNPFNALQTLSELLVRKFDDMDVAIQKKYISNMHRGIREINTMLRNLYDWSYSQRGLSDFNPTKINLSVIADEACKLLGNAAANKGIFIRNAIMDDLFVEADKNMLAIIFRSLISNAIKFTPVDTEGLVTLIARRISNETEKGYMEISVNDTGVGIAREKQHELFNLPGNYSTKGTEGESGTGLGLILCHEFVKVHGGKIWVESESDKGSTFYFTLPV